MRHRISDHADSRSGVEVIEVGQYGFKAQVSTRHSFAARPALSIHDLSGEKLVMSPLIRRSRQVFDGYLQQ